MRARAYVCLFFPYLMHSKNLTKCGDRKRSYAHITSVYRILYTAYHLINAYTKEWKRKKNRLKNKTHIDMYLWSCYILTVNSFFSLIVCICLVYKWPAQSRKDKCIENKDRILMHFCINWKVYKETMRNEFFVHIRIKFRLLISFHALNCVAYQ